MARVGLQVIGERTPSIRQALELGVVADISRDAVFVFRVYRLQERYAHFVFRVYRLVERLAAFVFRIPAGQRIAAFVFRTYRQVERRARFVFHTTRRVQRVAAFVVRVYRRVQRQAAFRLCRLAEARQRPDGERETLGGQHATTSREHISETLVHRRDE
jgi:hypothetical protein